MLQSDLRDFLEAHSHLVPRTRCSPLREKRPRGESVQGSVALGPVCYMSENGARSQAVILRLVGIDIPDLADAVVDLPQMSLCAMGKFI